MKRYICFSFCLIIIDLVLYYYGCLSKYNYFTASWDIRKGNYRSILMDPPYDYYIDEKKIASKYDIEIIYLKSSILINWQTKGVFIYNKYMKKAINKKLGAERYSKYLFELDSVAKEGDIRIRLKSPTLRDTH
ncbi:MAG: hypothetical protein NTY07_19505 [Bacteroidia bacterium]|nr:hypothetical protein [Bacteroidia bacterium]